MKLFRELIAGLRYNFMHHLYPYSKEVDKVVSQFLKVKDITVITPSDETEDCFRMVLSTPDSAISLIIWCQNRWYGFACEGYLIEDFKKEPQSLYSRTRWKKEAGNTLYKWDKNRPSFTNLLKLKNLFLESYIPKIEESETMDRFFKQLEKYTGE